jgi:hypothetical protein
MALTEIPIQYDKPQIKAELELWSLVQMVVHSFDNIQIKKRNS